MHMVRHDYISPDPHMRLGWRTTTKLYERFMNIRHRKYVLSPRSAHRDKKKRLAISGPYFM
jgi:hypothetical protein